mgnify:CR=1 FL=1
MKLKALLLILASASLVWVGWLIHVPAAMQKDEVPEKYRDTVAKGLEYLLKQQHKDGHWEGDDGKHPVAMTGLVGLALLMESPYRPYDGRRPKRILKHSEQLGKAVDWLLANSRADRDGLIFSEHASERSRYMQGHGLATLFLAGMLRDERDEDRHKKIHKALTRAVEYLAKAQSTQGGWYHTSKAEGHDFSAILPTVIQIQALQAAEHVGVAIPSDIAGLAREYLEKAVGKTPAEIKERRQADVAAALVCSVSPGSKGLEGRASQGSISFAGGPWLKRCQEEIPVGQNMKFGQDELAHYYYAQAVYVLAERWDHYRSPMFDHLRASQAKDGSWPAAGGLGVGPVYATALWCTVLQLDMRSHPAQHWHQEFEVTWRRPRCRIALPAA